MKHSVSLTIKITSLTAILWLALLLIPVGSDAGEYPDPTTYIPTFEQLREHKRPYDDPRPVMETFGPQQVLPPEMYKSLTWDVETMKKDWAELVGFRAPDVVGKKSPEIKPGNYTYKDLETQPGLKELFWPQMLERIKPGGPPFVGNIAEFEIVPTEQMFFATPICDASRENRGKTKLREDGYLVYETWHGGYPFPRPSGPQKAWQIMYNVEKRYLNFGLDFLILGFNHGYTKDLQMDFDCDYIVRHHRLAGRAYMKPYGFFDDRAQKRGEFRSFIMPFLSPRDIAGQVQSALYFLDPEKSDQIYMYIPSLRRVRKLSATDSQDPIAGQDVIYDDNEGFMQKLSPTRYPYETTVLEETEFLVAFVEDGSPYATSDTVEIKGLKFQRRPVYVVEMKQLDPNYVYSRRVFYIDQETWAHYMVVNYDQKDRLYRTNYIIYSWHPKMGMLAWNGFDILRDHIDTHSGFQHNYMVPALWGRDDVSMSGVISAGK